MQKIVIAYKKIREAARLLAAANERALADGQHSSDRQAQSNAADLQGFVRDPNGAAVKGDEILPRSCLQCSRIQDGLRSIRRQIDDEALCRADGDVPGRSSRRPGALSDSK